MERLRNPILFLVLLLLPFLLYFTGWRYWWPLQISLQILLCLTGIFFYFWRLIAILSLLLLLVLNLPWFSIGPDLPGTCRQQVDHFSGVVESDGDEQIDRLRLIKIEIWCRGDYRRWPSAQLDYSATGSVKKGWFRKGDRILMKNVTLSKRNALALDIQPASRFRIFSISYRDKILSRGVFLLYIQKKARYFLSPFPNSVYKALITADRTSLSDKWRKKINELGVTHLFAISGMHIGILYLWLSLALRWLISFPSHWIDRGSGVLLTDFVSILSIFLFLKSIGMPISAERSFIMLAWWGTMRHFLGWQPLWFILCGTAAVILFHSPTAIGQISFQLSFLSVAGIVQILPFLPQRRLQDSSKQVFAKLLGASLLISLWLFILTMPLVSRLAESFSLITALNNVVHIFYLSFIFLPFALLVMIITLLGYPWYGSAIEFYLYTILNFLGRLWEQMLVVNVRVNDYFLVSHLRAWNPLLLIFWGILFTLPFFVNWVIRRKRKQ